MTLFSHNGKEYEYDEEEVLQVGRLMLPDFTLFEVDDGNETNPLSIKRLQEIRPSLPKGISLKEAARRVNAVLATQKEETKIFDPTVTFFLTIFLWENASKEDQTTILEEMRRRIERMVVLETCPDGSVHATLQEWFLNMEETLEYLRFCARDISDALGRPITIEVEIRTIIHRTSW